MSAILNIATKAAYAAGNLIQQESRNVGRIKFEKKGHNDFVTTVDKQAEQIIIQTIKKAYPDHNILAEESGLHQTNHSNVTWIIDPIDGTTNFIHGNPQYCVSIAIKHDDKITHCVIFDPNRNDLYSAEMGKGAYLNDKRIRVSNTSNLNEALIATGFPTYDMAILDKYMAIFKEMILSTSGIRRAGSAALDLAYVAAGMVDGFWEFGLKPWDIAAGVLLIKEAGGMITDSHGKQNMFESGDIVVGNHKILSQLMQIISKHNI